MSNHKDPRENSLPTHPGWCDPRRCADTGKDFKHAAAPVPLTLGDQMWEFELRQLNEHAHPDEPGEVRLAIDLTEMAFVDADVQFEIPVQYLRQLIERLTIEENRARFLAAPVVRAAVVAS